MIRHSINLSLPNKETVNYFLSVDKKIERKETIKNQHKRKIGFGVGGNRANH